MNERGNVMFYILIAVALLAALIYAVSQSGRGSLQQVSDEKARLYASEIVEYANVVANAVAQLRLRSISTENLCFDDPGWGADDYDHAGCTDDARKIFHLSGGGVTWKQAPTEAMDSAATPDNLWHIYGDNEIQRVGTTCGAAACSDLILMVDELSRDVCVKINNLLQVGSKDSDPETDTDYGVVRYIGAFSYDETIGDESPILPGKTAACFRKSGGEYVFYKVLIAR